MSSNGEKNSARFLILKTECIVKTRKSNYEKSLSGEKKEKKNFEMSDARFATFSFFWAKYKYSFRKQSKFNMI